MKSAKSRRVFIYLCFCWLTLMAPKSSSLDIHASPQEFCYSDQSCGPESWEKFSDRCKGKHQSPVNLHLNYKSHQKSDGPSVKLPLSHFKCDHFFMQNNGHTLNLDFATYERGAHIFPGYGLTNVKYRFANAHFHWGQNDKVGSEHRINGHSYSMEMHLVHYKEKFNTMKEAIRSNETDALAVVAIFLQAYPEVTKPHPALGPIIRNLKFVHHKHWYWAKIEEPLDLTPLIPRMKPMKMFSYQGSLTTPGCNEQVNWYIFQQPILIAPSDIQAFRQLKDGKGQYILENYRPVQKPHGRRIEIMELGN